VLAPAQILERLSQRLDLFAGGRDADPRQRTLRSTIEWSHDLLDEAEQRLFARVSVFAGGATLGSAEDVADADLDTLQSLVEKSLIRHTDDRFWMYETIRGFALERLDESGEADMIRDRHAEHFLELSERAEPNLIDESLVRLGPWHRQMEAELDNVRAALDRFEAKGEGGSGCRMVGALAWFWEQRGQFGEGRRLVERALAAHDGRTPARARALSGAAVLAGLTGDLGAAIARAEEAVALHRAFGDTWRLGDAVHALGYAKAEGGDFLAAREHFEEAVRLLREAGDEHYAMWSRRSLGWTYHDVGDLDRAREIHEANLRRARELDNPGIEATTLAVLGTIAVDEGRPEDAFPLLEAAYRIHRDLGESLEVATDLSRFAAALASVGEGEKAVELSSLSDALREELGARVPWVERLAEQARAEAQVHLDPVAFEHAWERGKRLTPDAAVAMALAGRVRPRP
jgi:non-specific serine/threonine protein kinase